ncbi:hypothetical protein DLAC_10736 [Tieghemostelium lacteum]|uniref:RNA polymerase II subunit A C-terminal domain phosphatase n=1 Tax=Tieghemostelium lacteum TaxID=361077 RepID=A0A151Z4J0_TIELA|nr:hypothetical protein DLAC_10736 [Tieghemostelium lacteum]|eukprot:KYQ88714.1 hypothetical protein DLAC_10736 [Tieghemostelium lacteum]
MNITFPFKYEGYLEHWNYKIGDSVDSGDTIAVFTLNNSHKQQVNFISQWDGIITDLLIKNNDNSIISINQEIMKINICTHDVQFSGLCASCGRDLTKKRVIRNIVDNSSVNNSNQHSILHGHSSLTVSKKEAQRLEDINAERLRLNRKLSLVLDLDHTVIHAVTEQGLNAVDRWNHVDREAKGIKKIVVNGMMNYCIKIRPHIERFLQRVNDLFELHIYTMGTRNYATEIAKLLDPTQILFKERILSRDDSIGMNFKTLQRLFPCDDSMVVIVDDRSDVWKKSRNLLQIAPYIYFSDVIDSLPHERTATFQSRGGQNRQASQQTGSNSNGRLLPDDRLNDIKQLHLNSGNQDLLSKLFTAESLAKMEINQDLIDKFHSLDVITREQFTVFNQGDFVRIIESFYSLMQFINNMSWSDVQLVKSFCNSEVTLENMELDTSSNQILKSLKTLKPTSTQVQWFLDLLKFLKIEILGTLLNNRDDHVNNVDHDEDEGDEEEEDNSPEEDDHHLLTILSKLEKIHETFYKEFSEHKKPHVQNILDQLKKEILEGCFLVLSGVYPLGTPISHQPIRHLAEEFGAIVENDITSRTTHVVAARKGTTKVNSAIDKGINVVSSQWIVESTRVWQRADESFFQLPDEPTQQVNNDSKSKSPPTTTETTNSTTTTNASTNTGVDQMLSNISQEALQKALDDADKELEEFLEDENDDLSKDDSMNVDNLENNSDNDDGDDINSYLNSIKNNNHNSSNNNNNNHSSSNNKNLKRKRDDFDDNSSNISSSSGGSNSSIDDESDGSQSVYDSPTSNSSSGKTSNSDSDVDNDLQELNDLL